jgi:transcriptional regulator with XRE-family HTH domain
LKTNTIKELAKIKKISLRTLSAEIGMSVTGFHQALSNDSLKVKALEKIAEVLDVPVAVFFKEEEEALSIVNEGNFNYAGKNKGDISQSFNKGSDQECWKLLAAKDRELAEVQKKYIALLEKK